MAYALIAGVDPGFGLYSAIDVTLLASIFDLSSHLINGPDERDIAGGLQLPRWFRRALRRR